MTTPEVPQKNQTPLVNQSKVTPETPDRDQLRISLLSWVVLFLFCILPISAQMIVIVRHHSNSDVFARALGELSGSIIAVMFFVFIATWLAKTVSRNSSRAANITFCVMLILTCGMYRSSISEEREQNAKAYDQFDKDVAALQRKSNRRTASADGDEQARAEIARQDLSEGVQLMNKTANAMTGNEAIMAKAMAEVLETMQQRALAYAQCTERIEASGGVHPSTLNSQEEIAEKIKILEEAYRTESQLQDIYLRGKQIIKDHMARAGVPQKDITRFSKGFDVQRQWDLCADILECELKTTNIFIELMKMVDSKWDQIIIDPESGELYCDDEQFIEKYNNYFADIDAIILEQEQLQQSLAEKR